MGSSLPNGSGIGPAGRVELLEESGMLRSEGSPRPRPAVLHCRVLAFDCFFPLPFLGLPLAFNQAVNSSASLRAAPTASRYTAPAASRAQASRCTPGAAGRARWAKPTARCRQAI